MRLDRGPGSSLGDTLLAASLKALTTDQPSAELVTPAAGCEPLCVNQAVRTSLLVIMPTLDDVDIARVQRGDQSHDVVIPGSGGPAGSRSGASAGGRGGAAGGSSAASSSSTAALGKGKQMSVILDDDDVSSDEDEPLQKQLRQLSSAGPTVLDEAAVDKRAAEDAAAKRAAEEVATTRVAEERATEDVTAKAATVEAAGAARGSSAPG
jgi:hypothetical protein